MICKNCNAQFEEGVFCPECGTKYEKETESVEKKYEKAYDILNEYEKVEEETARISELGWPNSENEVEKIKQRISIYKKAQTMNIQTDAGKKVLQKMKNDINADYHKYKEKDMSIGAAIICYAVISLLAIKFLSPWGIIGKGLVFIVIASCGYCLFDLIRTKRNLEELEGMLKRMDE